MTHRNHRSRSSLTWMVMAAVLLGVPLAASADHYEWRRGPEVSRHDHGHRGSDRVDARRRYDDHAFRGDRRASHRAADHRRVARFYCRPCRHRFASKVVFHRHLRRHHHVAPWQTSRRVFHNPFGWIFFR